METYTLHLHIYNDIKLRIVSQMGNAKNYTSWALVVRKPDFGAYEQQRRRPACASAQAGPRLCYLLSG